MNTQDLIRAIHRLKVETGSLACFGCGYEHSCSVRGCAILRSAAAALGKNQWIPVTERLPEDSANVLVCHKNGLVATNAWLGAHWWFKNERNPITHWMPLPEPTKGE